MIYRYNIKTPNGEYTHEADHDLTPDEWEQFYNDKGDPDPAYIDLQCAIIEE